MRYLKTELPFFINGSIVLVDPIRTVTVCERSQKTISCPGDLRIRLKSSFWGRSDTTTCRTGSFWRTSCSDPTINVLYKRTCERKNSCTVSAHASQLGDPCPGTSKYVRIQYECVKKGKLCGLQMFFP